MNTQNTSAGGKPLAIACAACLGLLGGGAFADTTITNGATYTIDNSNTTSNPTYRVWNDTGTLTMSHGATLLVQPNQRPPAIYINDAILFTGGVGTITMKFNNNDADYLLTNSVSSTATGGQTLAIFTGHLGNGDRASVTFSSGVPNGAGMSLSVTFRAQTAQPSWVNLAGANTFTGGITLAKGGALSAGYLTIGGTITRYLGATSSSGSLNGGQYAGAISLDTNTVFNYASTAAQTLAGPITGFGAVQVTGSGALTLAGTNTYRGNTVVSNACSLLLATNGALQFWVTDTTNSVVTGAGAATFDGTFNLDTSAVTLDSNAWTLVSTTAKVFGATFGLAGFTGPVSNIYTKTGGDRIWTFNKANGVLRTMRPALITSFGVPGYAGIINQSNKTIALSVPSGIPLATLAPTYTLTSGSCTPPSGSPPSPSFAVQNPATYRVVDGATTNTYLVTVTLLDYSAWSHSAPVYVLTTTNGANLPGSALETNFPILLRLNNSTFNFSQARTNGADIRFTTAATNPLPYEIEQWDAVNGAASIWVRVPAIQGNTNQPLIMYWGNTNATSESSGPSVFNSANGYACVMHMNGVKDSVGLLVPTNAGTTATNGVVGPARRFAGTTGINCGQNIGTFPSGNNPHTAEAWFRADASGSDLMGFGIQQGQGKVVMQLLSPPRINMDCWFSAGNVAGTSTLARAQWYHVAHVYTNQQAKVYVNGVLDGSASGGTAMAIPSPARMYVGGWWGTYSFVGDMDEVRVSSVPRSANWMWLQYQNQNPIQALVGHPVQTGSAFGVSATNVVLNEGATANLTAQAGGAVKVYWLRKQNGHTNVVAVDQFSHTLAAGRVASNQSYVIQFKAVYLNGTVQTSDIAVTVLDTIPDPVFSLVASTTLWDGRQTMTVTPVISNLAALAAVGATNFNYDWSVAGLAVVAQNPPGFTAPVLTVLRSQGTGLMAASLVLDNGGAAATNSITVAVQEPISDAWVERTPGANEKPVNSQFYARDDAGCGTIHYNGTIGGSPDSVFLSVYANGVLYTNITQSPTGGAYALRARILAGLVTYSVRFGSVSGGVTNVLDTVTNLVCGEAYIIDGQSNAVTSDVPDDFSTNQWVRSYGKSGAGWGYAAAHGGNWSIGYWGWSLATNIVHTYGIPICIINGAVGGTRIDQHQANPYDHYAPYGNSGYTIYADLLTRVAGAQLTHGIRGFLWHQGEQDQGAQGPDGDYDYKFYPQYFVDMSAAWKQDCPNLRYYYLFQIWPAACGDTSANDRLRETQRTLPRLYSTMRIMSTLGIVPGSSCHYSVDGYRQFFHLMGPLVKQDNYGFVPATDITAPDLKQAYFTTTNRNEIALVFGQNMVWNSGAAGFFYMDYASPASPGVSGTVMSGSASGHVIKLQLAGPSTNKTVTYVVGSTWGSAQANLIVGSNGIAALTFCSVPLADPAGAGAQPWITSLAPSSGRTNGGTVVTVTGSNFLAGASVHFGGSRATGVSVDSPTQITGSTPAHDPGAVDVVVVNTDGGGVTNRNAFTYVLPPWPATLNGIGLSGPNLLLAWAGGSNQICVLLTATNVMLPLAIWEPVDTNLVGPGGFSTHAIPLDPGAQQRYYLLSTPYN